MNPAVWFILATFHSGQEIGGFQVNYARVSNGNSPRSGKRKYHLLRYYLWANIKTFFFSNFPQHQRS